MVRASGNRVKPEFWRPLKDIDGMDPNLWTLGRYYPIVGMVQNTLLVWTINDQGNKNTINGMRLGLRPLPNPDRSKFDRIIESLFGPLKD